MSQPAAPGMLRAELEWQGRPGMAATVTSALAGWHRLRFEVTEEASPGCDAMRYSCTPGLGLFSATTIANGDVVVPESRLRAAMTVAAAARSAAPGPQGSLATANEDPVTVLEDEIGKLLGQPWDEELEPFRCAADGAPVRWLHATG